MSSNNNEMRKSLKGLAAAYYTEDHQANNNISSRTSKDSDYGCKLSSGEHTLKLRTASQSDSLGAFNIHKIWCMVDISAHIRPKDADPTLIDFVVVIDHSSSMRVNDKLAHVKATIQYLVEQLTEANRFCLIEFNHDVNMVTNGLLVMNADNKRTVLENLKRITPEGSTNISGALFTAVDIVKKRSASEQSRISSIMLFTDGLANAGSRGTQFSQELVNMIVPQGLTISTFGYGEDHDSKILQTIALTSKGGVYYYIESTESIAATFGENLAGILSTVAHNVNVRLTGADGCRLVSFYTKFPITEHKSVKDYTVSLGTLYSRETRGILFKLSIRKLSEHVKEHQLLTVKVCYTNTLTGQDVDISSTICVARPQLTLDYPIPIEMDRHINRYVTAAAMDKAAVKAASRDLDGALTELDCAIRQIENSTSANSSEFRGNCSDMIRDLREISSGMRDPKNQIPGTHYIYAYSTMYFLERSTGTRHLRGISSEFHPEDLERSQGYGYQTEEQREGAIKASTGYLVCLDDYLSP